MNAALRVRRDAAAAGVVFSGQNFWRAQWRMCETQITSRPGKSGGGPPQSKTLARLPMTLELREASWSAVAKRERRHRFRADEARGEFHPDRAGFPPQSKTRSREFYATERGLQPASASELARALEIFQRAGGRELKRRERRAPGAPGRRCGRGGFFWTKFLAGAMANV